MHSSLQIRRTIDLQNVALSITKHSSGWRGIVGHLAFLDLGYGTRCITKLAEQNIFSDLVT